MFLPFWITPPPMVSRASYERPPPRWEASEPREQLHKLLLQQANALKLGLPAPCAPTSPPIDPPSILGVIWGALIIKLVWAQPGVTGDHRQPLHLAWCRALHGKEG